MLGGYIFFAPSDGHSILDKTSNTIINSIKHPILIGDNVWIGAYSIILKNTSIPNNTIIAASSVVSKSFTDENTIIGGNPAKIIKKNVIWNRTNPFFLNKYLEIETSKNDTLYQSIPDCLGKDCLWKLIKDYEFESVLDLGAGEGIQSRFFQKNGKKVTAIVGDETSNFKKENFDNINLVFKDFLKYTPTEKFDCIWASHILEHQFNIGLFLDKTYNSLKDNGILALTVPPRETLAGGGHLYYFSPGNLIYHLLCHGFDLRNMRLKEYGYNLSIICHKRPDFTKFDNLVLASSIFLFYAGMEMGGIHVKDVENPSVNYPKAVFIGALITVLIFVLGTFALGIIIPQKDINLTQSLLVGFDNYFKFIHASWLSPVIAVALAFGVLAGVLTWVAGPSKGIFAVGKAGYLPPFFQKTNKLGVQKNILLVQGLAVTFLSLLFVVMPSVQSFYQILSQLTVILYLIMYMLMFSGAIALRYRMKKAGRPFRIGKSGKGLMWFIGGLGFCGSLLAFVLSFIPPSQISTGNNTVWFAVLIIGAIVVVAAPFIIYAAKKPSWVDPNTAFEPFHWEVDKQVEGTAATATSIASETTASASKTSDRNTVTGISSSGTSGKI